MVINKRLQIVFILVFFLGVFVIGQDKQVNEDKNKKLKKDILSVFESKGEEGLRSFLKNKKDKISNEFIVDFAKAGVKERKEEWLKVCKIMAEERKDEKTVADVLYKTGEYFRLISDNKKAFDYFNKAHTIYQKLNDLVGQGNIFLGKGTIYFFIGENKKASEMYDKALPFFVEANDGLGQGNFYYRKGNIYLKTGNNIKAFEMFEKALPFFEKVRDVLGQGKIYLSKGNIYFYTGKINTALDMYDKALFFYKMARDFVGQGNVYWRKGDTYSYTGKKSRSLEMYNKALLFFKKARDFRGQGSVYRGKGDIYLYMGNNKKALEMYEKALSFYNIAKDPLGQANSYISIGRIYFYTGDNFKALNMFKKAVPLYEKVGDLRGLGNLFLCKASVYLKAGENQKAFEMYEKAFIFFVKAGAIGGQGHSYKGKGDIYFRIGNNAGALEMYNKSLYYYEKIGDTMGQGNIYMSKGDIFLRTGETSRANDMYDNALTFFKKDGFPLNLGNVCKSKGDVCLKIGDNKRALDMYNKALYYYKKAEEPIGQGNVYWHIGEIYLRTGDNERAISMFNKALNFYDIAGDPIGQGNVYKSKGNIYTLVGNYKKALEMYEQALYFYNKAEDPIGKGDTFRSEGDVYLKIGNTTNALKMYDKALPFFKNSGDLLGQSDVYKGKGDTYYRTGVISKALRMYDKAINNYLKIGAIEAESFVLHGKAKVLLKLRKKEVAMPLFEKGIANLEKVRTQTAFSKMKKTFLVKVYEKYEETVIFMLENKFYEKGFKYTEAIRGRVFLDRMAEELVPLERGLAAELKEQRDKLVAKLSLLNKKMYQTAGKEDEKKLKELKEQYRKVENDFEDLLIKIRLENPLYASVRYPEPVSVQDLQKNVLKKGEILVRYFISPEKLYVFLISKKSFKVVPIKVEEKEIKNIVERYLLAVKENSPRPIMKYGKILYEKMFKPIEKRVKKSREIIIIPDGELAKTPFETFIIDKKKSGRPVFLLEKHKIKYIQSASVLSILRKHYHRDSKTRNFIGFGDPVYNYGDFIKYLPEKGSPNPEKGDEIKEIHRGKYDREGGKLIRIKGSGQEVKIIAELFKKKESDKCVVYLREKASEDNAKDKQMKDFDFIHFSCHGILGDDFQSLVLSQLPPEKSHEDGYLTLNEIMNCNYNAKLVVLSACQTGSGKLERAEGVTGLTRAVMYTGTPAVVASLWKVDDISTKELMVNFYRNMLEKKLDKVEALRQAKLELIKNKNYSSPLFWSAFVMYGE